MSEELITRIQFWGKYLDVDISVHNSCKYSNFTENEKYIITSKLSEACDEIVKERIKSDTKLNITLEKSNIISLFNNELIYIEETDNEYYNNSPFPWYIVTTKKGRIKIGRRKRVINIDWSDSIIDKSAEDLFPNEDVTKFNKTIHAWGYEKAEEYISKILE